MAGFDNSFFSPVVITCNSIYHFSAYITQRSYGPREHVFYEGQVAVLNCDVMGYPKPYVAWLSDGVLIQNKTTDTALNLTINDTAGSKKTYECYASNIHGKDYLPITVTIAGNMTSILSYMQRKNLFNSALKAEYVRK